MTATWSPTTRDDAHVRSLLRALDALRADLPTARRWGEELATRLALGSRVLVAGNGGSAAQAQHLTAELVGRYAADRPAFSAICLSAETSTLTALVNDYAPTELFARQVEAHGRDGDVVILLSTSGRSPNVVAAAQRARQRGLAVWALTGSGPNPLTSECDEHIAVAAPSTATVQECHLVLLHVICEAFDAERNAALATTASVP